MRLSASAAIAASVARCWSVRGRGASPITRCRRESPPRPGRAGRGPTPSAGPCDHARRAPRCAGRAAWVRSRPGHPPPRPGAAARRRSQRHAATRPRRGRRRGRTRRRRRTRRRDRPPHLVEQGADPRAVVVDQRRRDDPPGIGVRGEAQLLPGPARPAAVPPEQPSAGAAELRPRAVHRRAHGPCTRSRRPQAGSDGRGRWRALATSRQLGPATSFRPPATDVTMPRAVPGPTAATVPPGWAPCAPAGSPAGCRRGVAEVPRGCRGGRCI